MAAEAIDLHSYRRNVGLHELSVESFLGRFRAGLATEVGEDDRRLSAGERRMLGLIRALLPKPAVLILDEEFNALDPEAFAQAVRLVRAHARDGAVLLVSHLQRRSHSRMSGSS